MFCSLFFLFLCLFTNEVREISKGNKTEQNRKHHVLFASFQLNSRFHLIRPSLYSIVIKLKWREKRSEKWMKREWNTKEKHKEARGFSLCLSFVPSFPCCRPLCGWLGVLCCSLWLNSCFLFSPLQLSQSEHTTQTNLCL